MISLTEKQKRLYKALGIVILVPLTLFVIIFAYLEAKSPLYLFINDTEASVHAGIIAQTSPGVRFDLEPGEHKFVDMPYWWHLDHYPPRYDFIVFQIFYLSDDPHDLP